MSDATEVLTVQEGQAAVKQVAVSGEIISLPSATDVKAIVQTDKGPVAAVKTVSLGGGGASGNFVEQLSTMPEASTKQGKIVQYVGTEAGTYNHGAFYESVMQSGGTNSYSDFYYQREADVTDTDVLFGFVNTVLESDGQPPLAVGDSVAMGFWQAARPDYEETEEGLSYIKRTNSAGVSQTVKVTDEWLGTNYPDGFGLDLAGGVPEYVSFTVTGVAATTYVWQELDLAGGGGTSAETENYASVLSTTAELGKEDAAETTVSLDELTAMNIDGRPSHKSAGATVYADNGVVGIISSVDDASGTATVVTTTSAVTLGALENNSESNTSYSLSNVTAKSGLQQVFIGDGLTVTQSLAGATFNRLVVIGANAKCSGPALVIGGNAQGGSSFSLTDFATVVGVGAKATGAGASSYGHGASATGKKSVAIGRSAEASAAGSIQIGPGSNSTADTFNVGNTNGNFNMMSADGSIPVARLSQLAEQKPTAADATYILNFGNQMFQMGGIVDLPSMGPGVAVENTPVTLPKELANANYVVQLTVITDSGFQQVVVDASNRTTTGFDVCARNNDTAETVTGAKVAWTVVGVAPLS